MYHDCRPSFCKEETLTIVVPGYISELIARHHTEKELGGEDSGSDVRCHLVVLFLTLSDVPMSHRRRNSVEICSYQQPNPLTTPHVVLT